MNIGNVVGIALAIKLVNGKIKPKRTKGSIVLVVVFVLLVLAFISGIVYGLMTSDYEIVVIGLVGCISFGYILLISPYTQNSNNYYIEFQDENTLSGFKLSYKGKLVDIKYIVANDGKIAFANNSKKTACVSYADGSKMSTIVKYKIVNYFAMWLMDNNLISEEVTTTFE